LIGRADLATAYFALDRNQRHLPAEVFARLVEQARRRHGPHVDYLLPVFAESRRVESLLFRRLTITDPDHRFLLAALLTLPDRTSIFDFVRRCYPGEPAERITGWVKALTHGNGRARGNPLGIQFNGPSLIALKCLLEDRSFAQVEKRLKEDYAAEDVDAQEAGLRRLCADLCRSALLRPLLARAQGAPAQREEAAVARP
jgi:hypothetical protein